MNKGKVIIIGGNKRAGKTTLTMKLHKEYNFNYYNYDMLLDSLEDSFQVLQDQNDEKYIKLLEEMVKRSLDEANNYGISTVYEYIFTPKQLQNFKYRKDVQIYFLANLDANEDNIREDLLKYSKNYDWPSYVSDEDIERNINYILKHNNILVEDCKKYGFELINTSRDNNRNIVLDNLVNKILNK